MAKYASQRKSPRNLTPLSLHQWATFLRRNGLTGIPERFSEVAAVLRKFFEPVLRAR